MSKIVNVASVLKRSPFRYPGGKTWLVPLFRRWMIARSKTRILVEPFAGGGIIGLTAAFENLADQVVFVELDNEIASVWETIVYGDVEKLTRKIVNFELTIKSAKKILSDVPKTTLDLAFQTIIKNRVNYGGIMASGSSMIKNGENNRGITSRWYPDTLAKRILNIATIRNRLTFFHGSAFDILPKYLNCPSTALFIDPPYTAAGKRAGKRLYNHHQLDHDRLFDLIKDNAADPLFTYDNSEEIKKKALLHKLKMALVPMKNGHHATMSELLIARNLQWLGDANHFEMA